jgi:tRNA modification GTPase
VVLDWSRALREEEKDFLRSAGESGATVLLNKADLKCGVGLDQVLYLRKRFPILEVSAKTGEGISDLRRRLLEVAAAPGAAPGEGAFLTNVRHRDLLQRAAQALLRAQGAARDGLGDEYVVLDLEAALDHLGEITGAVGVEGIYERIFKNFCIGK